MATAGQQGETSELPEEDEIIFDQRLDQEQRKLHKIAETHLGVRRYELLEYAERASENGEFSVNDYIEQLEQGKRTQFDAKTIDYILNKASKFTDKIETEGFSIGDEDYGSNTFQYDKTA